MIFLLGHYFVLHAVLKCNNSAPEKDQIHFFIIQYHLECKETNVWEFNIIWLHSRRKRLHNNTLFKQGKAANN